MSEETKDTATAESPELTGSQIRSSDLFKQVTGQMSDLANEKKALEAKLAEFEKQQEAAKQKELESQGKYEEALAQVKTLHIAELEAAQAELATMKINARNAALEAELAKHGLDNEFAIAGIKAQFSSSELDPTEFVKQVSESDSFKALLSGTAPRHQAPPSTTAASRSGQSWSQVYADRDSSDQKVQLEAVRKLTAYYTEHGQFPPKG